MRRKKNNLLRLALTSFNFVSTEVFLGFNVQSVSTSNWVVLSKTDFLGSILSVLGSVIGTVASEFADESNQFALSILFCHKVPLNNVLPIEAFRGQL